MAAFFTFLATFDGEIMRKEYLLLFTAIVSMLGCHSGGKNAAKGFLEISYRFKKASGVQPSYQTAIWLEDENGDLARTLFVSEYLSYGGFHDSTICPNWSRKANWDNIDESMFDAVTAATPSTGENSLKVDCQKENIAPGTYRCCVQVHIVENYNIMYCGTIKIGDGKSETIAMVDYSPGKHPLAGDVLNDVKLSYSK